MLMNDLAKLHVVCFSNDFLKQAWLIQNFKVLDLNIHVKHIMGFSLKVEK